MQRARLHHLPTRRLEQQAGHWRSMPALLPQCNTCRHQSGWAAAAPAQAAGPALLGSAPSCCTNVLQRWRAAQPWHQSWHASRAGLAAAVPVHRPTPSVHSWASWQILGGMLCLMPCWGSQQVHSVGSHLNVARSQQTVGWCARAMHTAACAAQTAAAHCSISVCVIRPE
jgi:hypothetical protein